jgi:GT2 family glycosyltransferase
MRIATITTAHNQFQDFENWKKFYSEYKDEIGYHLIVDNGSSEEYRNLYKKAFSNSIIIELKEGRGVTGGYNAGIKYIQKHIPEVDFILFIMQDMNIPKGGVGILANCLSEDIKLGVIAPVNLYENHSNIIREHGGMINWDLTISKNYLNKKLTNEIPEILEVDFLCGGNYMFKTKLFTEAGLFDENIFMYGDETDILLRVKKLGYKIISTTKTVCWHEHIYLDKIKRLPSDHAIYYTAKNYFYLIKKHQSLLTLVLSFIKSIYVIVYNSLRFIFKDHNFKKIKCMMEGYKDGLLSK